ncbi:MAG: CvpA family protein [Pseudomonadota bacterium]|nr:CvpA family protein [Pseudomonadota bacterium]
MSVADIVVLVIVLLSGIIAFRLGIVRVILSLGGWVGATLATIYSYSYTRPLAREWIENELIADILAGTAIFVLSMIVLTLISQAIANVVRDSSLGMLDRSFGLLIGLMIGGVIISGGYIFSQQGLKLTDQSSFYKDSKTLPLVKRGAMTLSALAPDEWGVSVSLDRLTDREDQFRSLMSPKPEPRGEKKESGYKPAERREMDRLIRNHQ